MNLSLVRAMVYEGVDGRRYSAYRDEPGQSFFIAQLSEEPSPVRPTNERSLSGGIMRGLILNVEVLAEFPRSLRLLVGDATAFRAATIAPADGDERTIVVGSRSGMRWIFIAHNDGDEPNPRVISWTTTLGDIEYSLDLDTVVPLRTPDQ